jgi:hypothetical protein
MGRSGKTFSPFFDAFFCLRPLEGRRREGRLTGGFLHCTLRLPDRPAVPLKFLVFRLPSPPHLPLLILSTQPNLDHLGVAEYKEEREQDGVLKAEVVAGEGGEGMSSAVVVGIGEAFEEKRGDGGEGAEDIDELPKVVLLV